MENMKDYYDKPNRKALDFLIGAFAFPIALYFFFYLLNWLLLQIIPVFVSLTLTVCLTVAAIVLAFKKNRRYIGIGIIAGLALPLLIFGTCLLVLSGSSLY
jgi:hypothetical protein